MIAESTSLRARRRVFVRSSRFAHMEHMKRGARAAPSWQIGEGTGLAPPHPSSLVPLPYSPNSAFSGVMGRVRT